jgi:hypothetical protein
MVLQGISKSGQQGVFLLERGFIGTGQNERASIGAIIGAVALPFVFCITYHHCADGLLCFGERHKAVASKEQGERKAPDGAITNFPEGL